MCWERCCSVTNCVLGSCLLGWIGLNAEYIAAFFSWYACFVVLHQWECVDLLLITGLVSHCSVLAADISILGSCSMINRLILIFQCTIPKQLKCRASLAWEPFPLCLCTQAIAPHTGRASRWVLSNSYWFHGTLVCLLHQLRAHQLCTTGFGVDWLPERVLVLIWFTFLPRSPQTASPVQGRLQRRPAAGWNVGPWGPLVVDKQHKQSWMVVFLLCA